MVTHMFGNERNLKEREVPGREGPQVRGRRQQMKSLIHQKKAMKSLINKAMKSLINQKN